MAAVDRATGQVNEQPLAGRDVFRWLYGSALGRAVGGLLFRSTTLHRLVGWYASSRWSRRHIGQLVEEYAIDLSEAEIPPGGFGSLNAFFTRRMVAARRPIDTDPATLASPADARVAIVPELRHGATLRVKGASFTLEDLLADAALARRFDGGAGAIFRMYLPDCHRVVFPCAGVPAAPRAIAGHFYSVSPIEGNDVPFHVRNARSVTLFDTDLFGTMALVDVGGFLISSIQVFFKPGCPVRRGDEKSAFLFGGSTVVLLAEAGRVRFDDDLCRWTRAGHEVNVRIGERIGRPHAAGGEHHWGRKRPTTHDE